MNLLISKFTKKQSFFALFFSISFSFSFLFSQVNNNHIKVNGYHRSNGTYVEPHYRTAPNSTNMDNFSTAGNINPYTNEVGTVPKDNYSGYQSNFSSNQYYFTPSMPVRTNYDFELDLRLKTNSNNNYSSYSNQYKFYNKLSSSTIKELEAMLFILDYKVSNVDGKVDNTTI